MTNRRQAPLTGWGMPLGHVLLALTVVAIWGSNFVVATAAVTEIPPFAFATLRFLFACLPWLFFLPRPPLPWELLIAFGFLMGVGHFGLLAYALHGRVSPGIESVLLQVQVPLTVLCSAMLNREPTRLGQQAGVGVALVGAALIAWHSNRNADASVSIAGVLLVLGSAGAWACANVLVISAGPVAVLPFMAWSSSFAVLPLALLSLAFDPPGALVTVWRDASLPAWVAVAYQVIGNALFGYAVWNWLLARHPSAIVAPFALLVPVVGIGAAASFADEPLPPWKLLATSLILSGVALNFWQGQGARRARGAAADGGAG